MNDSDERREVAAERNSSSSPHSANDAAAPNVEGRWATWRRAIKKTFGEYLSRTTAGPLLELFRQMFGLTGILLLAVGFLASVVVAYAGLLPPWLVCRARACGEYEMVANPNAVMAQALADAKYSMEASGVALTFIDPHVLEQKMEGGFSADLVLLDPCSEAVTGRADDAGHTSGARRNILNQLRRFKEQLALLPREKRGLLRLRLSKRPATMAVGMFDRRDLYAYWCRYGAPCTDSPLLVFRGYGGGDSKNAFGLFFEQHYDAVSRDAGQPLDLDSYDLNDPCPALTPGGAARP